MEKKLLIIGDPVGNHSLIALRKYAPENIWVWENDSRHIYTIHQINDRIKVVENLDVLNGTMHFDVVIGNPPYQKGKNSIFYVDFINKAADLTKEGGVVTLVTPNRFMLPHTPASQVILSNFQVEKYWIDVNEHFPTVGTNIGMFKVIRSNSGHKGLCDFELSNGEVVRLDPREITLPSRLPTVEGLRRFEVIKTHKHFEFVKQQPTHENYVYVCRQWKTKEGRPYFDAEVGHSKTGEKRDGRYIETDKPQEVCDYLRTTDYARELHQLFGDQMNIWPFLWNYIPTCL